MEPALAGGLAGLVATVPMTAVMTVGHALLPPSQQHGLPPKKITMSLAHRAGVAHELDHDERQTATVIGHFSYGAATGVLYGLLGRAGLRFSVGSGMAYGALVWAGSYLGWLPALGLHRSAAREPPARNGLMIAAHLVWGAALGLLAKRMKP